MTHERIPNVEGGEHGEDWLDDAGEVEPEPLARDDVGRFATARPLTDTDALLIRFDFLAGQSQTALAARYGVSQPSVSQVIRGVGRWDGLPPLCRPRPPRRRMRRRGLPPQQRFWSQVDVGHPLGCWLWTGGKSTTGYGYVQFDGRKQPAHRVAFTLLRGPIPPGMDLDHLCRMRACVNPDHLEPVTRRENVRRGYAVAAQRAALAAP